MDTLGPINEPGMFNIHAWDPRQSRWRGGMNRATEDDAVATAIRWSADDGRRYRVLAPDGRLVIEVATDADRGG
jgi:hypothetical protein